MSMTRDEAYEVFRYYASKEFEEIPKHDSEIEYTFSAKFNRKMDKLLKRVHYDNTHVVTWVARKVIVAAITVVLLLAGLMSVGAIREAVVEFVYDVYEGFMEVFYTGDTTDVITYRYSFSEIPEGFVEYQRISDDCTNIVEYENKTNGNKIGLIQTSTKDSSFVMDNNHGRVAEFVINDKVINIYISNRGKSYIAFWIEGAYALKLTYSGTTTVEEICQLIKTIK